MYQNVYMLNSVQLCGQISRTPEEKVTTSKQELVEFPLKIKRVPEIIGAEQTHDYFRIVAYGIVGKTVIGRTKKDCYIIVTGKLQSRKYTSSDGVTREIVEVIADSVQPIDRLP